MHAVNEPDWSRTLDAVESALPPGGRFLVETPHDDARPGVSEWVDEIAIGPHTLSYASRFEHRDDGSVDGRFSYTWRDEDGHVLYADTDHSNHGPQPPRRLGEALAARGFTEERRFDDVQALRTGATLSVFRLG